MTQTYLRRRFVAMAPLLLSGFAGCSTFSSESRTIGVSVMNHTDESLNVRLAIYKEDIVLAEQDFDLPGEKPDSDGVGAGSYTHINIDGASEGDKITAKITVNENRTETIEHTIDCDIDNQTWTGDGVAFRIREEYIETSAGCTSGRLR